MADLSDTIETAAGRPQSATVDGMSATSQPIAGLIQADQYLAMKTAARKRLRGVAYSRLVTPGPADDCGRTTGGFDSTGGLY